MVSSYTPDFSDDTKESLEKEYDVKITDLSNSMRYVVIKKKMERTYSLRELTDLFKIDLRDALNRYADTKNINLFCYHENNIFTQKYIEILAHTHDVCNISKVLEGLQNVPREIVDENGICNQCGALTDVDQDYCVDCFDKLDHNVVTANLREQKRLLQKAALYTETNKSRKLILTAIGKALELNIQTLVDFDDVDSSPTIKGVSGERLVTTKPENLSLDYFSELDEFNKKFSLILEEIDLAIMRESESLVPYSQNDRLDNYCAIQRLLERAIERTTVERVISSISEHDEFPPNIACVSCNAIIRETESLIVIKGLCVLCEAFESVDQLQVDPTVICSWCNFIEKLGGDQVTHTICDDCYVKVLSNQEELDQ